MTKQPIIGITYCQDTSDRHAVNSNNHAFKIACAGGQPQYLPKKFNNADLLEFVQNIDGLYLTGGEYLPQTEFEEIALSALNDSAEIILFKEALKLGKPILAVGRGMQLINAALGGHLLQITGRTFPDKLFHMQNIAVQYPCHSVTIEHNTTLYKILGEELIFTNSFHRQAIDPAALPSTFRVAAMASDGVIEAFESINNTAQIVGLQWYPECMDNDCSDKIYKYFAESAAKRSLNR